MRIVELLKEAKVDPRDRTLKKIEQYNQEVQIAIEKTGKAPAKIQKELNRLVAAFPEWADYQSEKTTAARLAAHDDMLARIKTAEFGDDNSWHSSNFIAPESQGIETAIALQMLGDVPGQLDDDIANVLSSFNTRSRRTNPPTKEEIEIAKAVIARAKELGVLDEYRKRVVSKDQKKDVTFVDDNDEEND